MSCRRPWIGYLAIVGILACSLASTLASNVAWGGEAKPKLPRPDKAQQAASLQEVKTVLADDYTKLSKAELARKLLGFGRETEKDATRRFVLFLEAGKTAVAAGEGPLIFEAVDALASYQDIDATEMKLKGLEHASKEVSKDDAEPLAAFILEFTDTLVEEDNYDAAKRLNLAARSLAVRSKDNDLLKQVGEQNRQIIKLAKDFEMVLAALNQLQGKPSDPTANLAAGKYYALTKGDWQKGLSMLALGNDLGFKSTAALDLTLPQESGKQIELADKWWELSDKQSEPAKGHLQARGAYWYRKALPAIQDQFVKTKVQNRLRDVASAAELHSANAKRGIAKAKTGKPGRVVKGRIYVCCDDSFEMYVNGTQVLKGGQRRAYTVDADFSKGDVVTVKAVNQTGPNGFCCVIKFLNGGVITTSAGWATYTPKSTDEWFKPENVGSLGKVVLGDSTYPPQKVVRDASGLNADQIWGQGNPSYLVHVIR